MLFADITYIDENFQVIPHAWVGVDQGRVAYIGQAAPKADYGEIYPGAGRLLIPGFFNAHSHTPMSLLRGYGENMNLQDWLHKRIFPFEARLTPEDVYWATLLCVGEMLRYGIVSTTDMYMQGAAMGDAFRDGGVKANFAVGISNFDGKAYRELPQCEENKRLIEEYHGLDQGRLQVDLSLHAEYTSQEKLVRSLAEAGKELGLRMQVHVSETAAEVRECQERRQGQTPVEYLNACGLFDQPATAAHCVHLQEQDYAILREKRVSVATCPKSNLKLASGICPAGRLLAEGINLALATDSVSSNNNLNFIEETRLFALIHKGVTGDPTLISPAQALYAATRAGALSQGRDDCGCIKVGNRADLVALNVDQPHMRPAHDLLNNLIYSATGSDVVLTMVDGEIRYRDGYWPHLDMERICAEADRSCRRIKAELGEM